VQGNEQERLLVRVGKRHAIASLPHASAFSEFGVALAFLFILSMNANIKT
jgi:hypothetical protein